jgi:hypothetical protein
MPAVSASGSTVSGTSRPIVSRMNLRRASQRAIRPGWRAASAARRSASAMTMPSSIRVEP